MPVFRSISMLLVLSAVTIPAQTPVAQLSPAELSPAEQRVNLAEAAIRKTPDQAQLHNDLASALVHRARETSDPAYYRMAEEAVQESLRLAPDNFEAQKIRTQVFLGKHEFSQALELARALNRRVLDDIPTYGLIADAAIELGNYKEAEEATQWMLNLRPPTGLSLTRAARLRELFGDIDGAFEFLSSAYRLANTSEVEDRAWMLTQMARLRLTTGKLEAAEKLLQQALQLFPGYHIALANLAEVRSAQQKYAEAIDMRRHEYQAVPHPKNLYALAEALEQGGRMEEAQSAYSEFEEKARARLQSADNANRELIFYYAGRAHKPAEALRIARREVSGRHDVYTLDAYAWALYVNGESAEARKQMESALAVGIRDADFFRHAGSMAAKLNDPAAAARYRQQSSELSAAR